MTDAIDGVGASRATSRTAAMAATMAMLAQAFQDDDSSSQQQAPASGLGGMMQQLAQVLQQAGQALQSGAADGSSGVQSAPGVGGAAGQGGGLMQALQALMQMLMQMMQGDDDQSMDCDPQAQQLANALPSPGAGTPSPAAPGGAGGGASAPLAAPGAAGAPAAVGSASVPQAAPGSAGVTQTSGASGSGKAPAGMPADQWQGCQEASRKTGIDPYILAAQAKQESQFGQALAGSPSAGDGVMQVEPSTRQTYAGKFQQAMGHAYDHGNVKDQIAMAAVILKDKGGSATNMLEKYNGGDNWKPGTTDSYGRPILADQYAAKVNASAEQMKAGG